MKCFHLKLFALALVLAAFLSGKAHAAPVRFSLTNFNVTTSTNSLIVTNVLLSTDGKYLIVGPPIWVVPTNGIAVTNLLKGMYNLAIYQRALPRPVMFYVPDDGSTTYDLTDLVTNGVTIYTYTNNPSGSVRIDSADTTLGLLSAKLLPGSNITFETNNPGGNESLAISATGGGGGSAALFGNGSPAGAVSATPGTSYLDTNQISFYVKTNGSGSAGWFWLIRGRQ